jgi:alkylhydroperoxidase/carboxymuconolactone decarboxylase family protein YurZ
MPTHDWPEMARALSGAMKRLRVGAEEPMKAFSALARTALESGPLDVKTKELIALAVSVATRCDGSGQCAVDARQVG